MRQVEFRASLSRSEFKRLSQSKSSAGWIAGAAVVALAWVFSAVGLGPAQLDFGTRQVGLSNRQPVRVTNRGLTEFHAASIAVEGADAPDFEIAGKSCATVSAGESCAVWVDFKPRQSGEKHARLVVRTADGSELSSEFKGAATPAPPTPLVVVPPGVVDDTKRDKPVHEPDQLAKNDPGPTVPPRDSLRTPENPPPTVDPGPVKGSPVQTSPTVIPPVENHPVVPPKPGPQPTHQPTPAPQQLYAHVTMSPGGASFNAKSADGEFFNAAAQTITVISDGTKDVRQLRLGLDGGDSAFSVTPACPSSLVLKHQCTVEVRFAPRDAQARDGSLIAYDGTARLAAVPLHGSVTVQPVTGHSHVSFKPREVQFPVSPSDGRVRLTQNVTVISDGTADVQRLALNVGPQGGPFTLPGGCPPRLARGQTCTLQVNFDQRSQQQYSGTVTAYDGNTALSSLPLRGGGGNASPQGRPHVTMRPSALTLSPPQYTAIYKRAPEQIEILNDGPVDLRGLNLRLSPAGSPFRYSNCPPLLPRGQACTVQVGFAPGDTRQYAATLAAYESGQALAGVQLNGSTASAAPPKQPGGHVTGVVDRAYPNNNVAPGTTNGAKAAQPGNATGNGNNPAPVNPTREPGYTQVGPNRAAAVSPQTQRAAPTQVAPKNVPQRRVQQKPPPPQIG